jgi:CelD/BcsL family acetyltransferase involved in cellulose biosynthesis
MSVTPIIVEDDQEVAALAPGWDRIAVAASRPFCAPGWALAWWRHAAPAGAKLRLVAVHDGEELIGVGPFFVVRGRYETLSAHLSPPAGPIAVPDREAEVGAAIAAALAEASPRPAPLRLEDQLGDRIVTGHILGAWPSRSPWVLEAPPVPLPAVVFAGLDFDGWLATKSSKFRQETRRLRRRLDDAGGVFRLVDAAGLDTAIDAFVELNGARWEGHGGSNAVIPGLREMLVDAAAELLPSGRLRIYVAEVEGRIIAVNILVAAGTEVCGWNSGFDPAWGKFSPSLLLTLHAVAEAIGRGEERMGLGPGAGAYKLRMADREDEIGVLTVVPKGRGYLLTRSRLLGLQTRAALSRRLSPEAKGRLRGLRRR